MVELKNEQLTIRVAEVGAESGLAIRQYYSLLFVV